MKLWTQITVVAVLAMVGAGLANADIEWRVLTRWPFRDPPPRVDVYEATIRYLADQPGAGQGIVVKELICRTFDDRSCYDTLSAAEIDDLRTRLHDVPGVYVGSDVGPVRPTTIITLGPITDEAEGTRVHAATWCGNVCALGAVYVLDRTEDGFVVAGPDDSYEQWLS